jgi:hypothetical protein
VIIGGPEGDTVLYAEVPEEEFRQREFEESTRSLTRDEVAQFDPDKEVDGLEYVRMGYAIIPAEILNRHGRPQLYDHEYAGGSRADLFKAINAWEQKEPAADPDAQTARDKHVSELRAAMEFFDKVGWQTPLALREPAPEDYAAPGPWFQASEE